VTAWYIDSEKFDHGTGLTAGVMDQQGMLTPPRHLIPSLVYPGIRISPFIYLTCNTYLFIETDHYLVS
jgi:hypothetical protein